VTASNESLASLHRILLRDLHPPLYQLLLKGWMMVFADSEFSSRSLSLIFAAASLYPLWKLSKDRGSVEIAPVAAGFNGAELGVCLKPNVGYGATS
jgi:hypothetical protein